MSNFQKSDNIDLAVDNGLNLNISGKGQKKKKNIWPVVMIIGICLCLFVFFLWKPIYNLFQEDDPKTIQDYEKHYLNEQIDSFLQLYDLIYISNQEEPVGVKVKTDFFADPFALNMIKKENIN